MPLKSFEEELHRKTQDFAMIPKANLWESIEPHLQKEKRNKRAIWIWLPVGIAAIFVCAILLNYRTSKSVNENVQIRPLNALQKQAEVNGKNEIRNEKINLKKKAFYTQSVTSNGSRKSNLFSPQKNIANLTINALNKSTELTNNWGVENDSDNEVILEPLMDSFENVLVEAEIIEKADTTKPKISQLNPVVTTKKVRTFAGISVLPNLAFTRVGVSGADPNANMAYQQREVNDKSVWNPGLGLHFGVEKGKHQLTAGIAYQNLSYRLYVENITREIIISNSSTAAAKAFVATDSFTSAYKSAGGLYAKNTYRYLSIPLGYQLKLMNRTKWALALAMGVQANFMVSSKALLYNESTGLFVKQSASQENHLNKINALWSAGFQLNYSLAPKCHLFFEPTYAASVLPVENATVKTWHQLYQFGLGVNWYLN